MEQTPQPDPAQRQGLTRRQVVRGAVAGAGVLWAAPIVTGMGLSAAHADTTSGKKPPTNVEGEQFTKDPHKLPFTGMQMPLTETLAIGGGLVAAGTVAVAASRRRNRPAAAGGPVVESSIAEASAVDDAADTDAPDGE